jgi:hypothetical protein
MRRIREGRGMMIILGKDTRKSGRYRERNGLEYEEVVRQKGN